MPFRNLRRSGSVMNTTFDPETKVWSGLHQLPVYNPEASFGQILLAVLRQNPTKVTQIDGDTGREMTREEMRLRAIRAAQNLTSLGYQQGDLVTVACSNSENLAPLVIALLTIGTPFNTLAPTCGVKEMAHMLKITQPKLVFCDATNHTTVKKAVDLVVEQKPQIYVFEDDSVDQNKAEDLFKETGTELMYLAPYLGNSREALGIILCSSGTTGPIKGVSLSHAHLITAYGNAVNLANFGLVFNFSPLYWATGLFLLMHSLINGDPRLITRKAFSEDVFFDLLEKYPIRLIFTPPCYAQLALRHPRAEMTNWSNITIWALGGSLVSEILREELDKRLPNGRSSNWLGNSEIGGICVDIRKRKPYSVGQLMANISAKIVDENGNAMDIGKHGELLLKFREKILGYFKNPEATTEAIDDEGWLRTGDVGYFDDEGFLFLTDRKKDMLKYMNYQVSPWDLEELIGRIEGVEQVCVIGLPAANLDTELPTAVIQRSNGSNLTEEEVTKTVNDEVADYRKLRGGVFFVEQFPMTPTGKILRKEVRKIILDTLKSKE
ncbi:probable 4-coumarate--CoA ligase 1 [Wyeomyia smithii]|uniref:probable 4-coumarate--CoA ligase 1 n=1 Tax=Wyeomyia smithii TaxID=174621 RepID=UPI002468172D|nr:probable 4-coumarate--CoA ligase 1 [Wyeomyia smithii]XP_055533051.1 probable 4-coumarate--CoA ligase 1 [Wyeomyia smithii]